MSEGKEVVVALHRLQGGRAQRCSTTNPCHQGCLHAVCALPCEVWPHTNCICLLPLGALLPQAVAAVVAVDRELLGEELLEPAIDVRGQGGDVRQGEGVLLLGGGGGGVVVVMLV